jgi:hypothetical protein
VPPAGEKFDKNQVNVQITVGSTVQRVGNLELASGCDKADGGWYCDDPDAPTKILVCRQTCDVIQAVTDARADILLGCATEPAMVK